MKARKNILIRQIPYRKVNNPFLLCLLKPIEGLHNYRNRTKNWTKEASLLKSLSLLHFLLNNVSHWKQAIASKSQQKEAERLVNARLCDLSLLIMLIQTHKLIYHAAIRTPLCSPSIFLPFFLTYVISFERLIILVYKSHDISAVLP